MVSLGITGGIGSGKSYVTRIFAALGVPCYDSDMETKKLYEDNETLQHSLIELLGEAVYSNGKLNTSYMASLIFNDRSLLARVNALVHPAVIIHFMHWAARQHAPYVIFESAILLELKPPVHMTRVLTVSADNALRLERVCRRQNISRDEVLSRMNKQWSDQERESRADFVISSNEKEALLPKVLAIHNRMLEISHELNC
jgi:dephospho-CoA kinase